MVIQSDSPIRVWGTANAGEPVSVTLGSDESTAKTAENGRWEVTLPPRSSSETPIDMKVEGGGGAIQFTDILVGDVWVCSGQSNMQFPLRAAETSAEALAGADEPEIRLFFVERSIAFEPSDEINGSWVVCTPESVREFSAVGYFFGQAIHKTQQIPVGLIGVNWGGTPAQAWTSLEALKGRPSLNHYVDSLNETRGKMPALMKHYRDAFLPNWERKTNEWKAAEAARTASEPSTPRPRKPTAPDESPAHPTVLFNGLIHPLLRYPIKGVIWYQGEANTRSEAQAREYEELFSTMIADWRQGWGIGDFPFFYVQLPGYETGPGVNFPALRESQSKVLSQPNTGMAVAIDLGDRKNIHPKNKRKVGERLALIARHRTYGEDVDDQGPTVGKVESEETAVRVQFDDTEGDLHAVGGDLKGFEIAGEDRQFISAEAQIDGDTVILKWSGASKPRLVRYAWTPFSEANLYDGSDLPAAPFSMEID